MTGIEDEEPEVVLTVDPHSLRVDRRVVDGESAATESCGWNEIGGIYREALIAGVGLARVRADPQVNRPLRPRLLAVFRRYERLTLAGTTDVYARLTGGGLTGTPAEMRLLADRLTAAGATVTLEPV